MLCILVCLLTACGPGIDPGSDAIPAPATDLPAPETPPAASDAGGSQPTASPAVQRPRVPTAAPTRRPSVAPTAKPTVSPPHPTTDARPAAMILPALVDLKVTHDYQKWNNCGPVSLSVISTYFGFPRDQYQAAAEVKGAEFDKNVGPKEMQAYLEGFGLRAIVRVNGSPEALMRLLALKIPVIVHQWLLKPDNTLVGHYRVVQGYDQRAGMFITSDPYTPPHKLYSFADFERWWQPWNRRYIVAYRPEQEADVRQALGADFDEERNLASALQAASESIAGNANDPYSYFSLGDDRLAGGDAAGALTAYDKALALGMLPHFAWYNFGPYEALYRTGKFQRIFDLSEPALKDANNVEEIHFWRGKAWLALGQPEKAKAELTLAVGFNAHYTEAKTVLASIP